MSRGKHAGSGVRRRWAIRDSSHDDGAAAGSEAASRDGDLHDLRSPKGLDDAGLGTPQDRTDPGEDAQHTPTADDSTCSAMTDHGEKCRRIADSDGLCTFHHRRVRGTGVVDPLELVDWTRGVQALGTLSAGTESPIAADRGEVAASMGEARTRSRTPTARTAEATASTRGAGSGTTPKKARHLQVVPEPGRTDGANYPPRRALERPDVLALDRRRALYRENLPALTEEKLDRYIETYGKHLSEETVRAYEQKLRAFFEYAARNGFDPLECEPVQVEGFILDKMDSGKSDGSLYSASYFKQFLSALRRAMRAHGLPDTTGSVDIDALISGYIRLYGAELPRMAKVEIRASELIDIERTVRLGRTYPAALERAAVALGCDPDLDLSVTQMCELTFRDVALVGETATVVVTSRGSPDIVALTERPGDPTCPVAALRSLREAARNRMRAERGGSTPTDAQLQDRHVFANQKSGAALSRKGLKLIVSKACANLQGIPPVKRGRLPALSPQQRLQVIATNSSSTTARDLALIFHTAFASARVGNVADFNVEHVEICGRDIDGTDTKTPLVDRVEPDGTVTRGILGRIGAFADTDILDEEGNSLIESGLIMGVRNVFAYGTKTQPYHENWYVVQPGWHCCPVLLLLKWLKSYDNLLATSGVRLAGHHPLFTNLKCVGQPIKFLSRTLGRVVKTAVASIGLPPTEYSAHSLRKFRASHVLSQGGNMTEVMLHDARASEVAGLAYARRDPRNPFAGDPTIGIFDKVTKGSDIMSTAHPKPDAVAHEAVGSAPATQPTPPEGQQRPSGSEVGLTDAVSLLRSSVDQLRSAGLDDRAIAAIAGLQAA